MEELGDDILVAICKTMDLKTRAMFSTVSHRLRNIVSQTDSVGISVVNVFEKAVWTEDIGDNLKTRIGECVKIRDTCQLNFALALIGSCGVLKVWFVSGDFLKTVVATASAVGMSMKGLDIYPYSDCVPLCQIADGVHGVSSLSMRPHGKSMFWKGFHLTELPPFDTVTTLALENIFLTSELRFPPRLIELEWKAPREGLHQLSALVSRLKQDCPNLKFLQLAHCDFRKEKDSEGFEVALQHLNSIQKMVMIGFKFCHFDDIVGSYFISEGTSWFPNLKAVRFDLCYGGVIDVVHLFVELAPNMQMLCFELMKDETGLQALYNIVPKLHKRGIVLKLAIMEKTISTWASSNAEANDPNRQEVQTIFPCQIQDTLTKLDLMFMTSSLLCETFFSPHSERLFTKLTEIRFIRSSAVGNQMIEKISQCCPLLTTLFLNGCQNVSDEGVLAFVKNWNLWKMKSLKVVVCGTNVRLEFPISFGVAANKAIAEYFSKFSGAVLPVIKTRWFSKNLVSDEVDKSANKFMFWQCGETKKILLLQNYTCNELNTITGFVADCSSEGPTAEESSSLTEECLNSFID